MKYNYNRLWKMLIDKGMTKTEMRKQAGISTNVLAKMGRCEPASMESLAKVCTALNCGFDDVVEMQEEGKMSNTNTESLISENRSGKSSFAVDSQSRDKIPGTKSEQQIDAINRLIDLNEKKKLAVSQYMTDLTVTIQPLAPYIYFTDAPMGICGLLATNLNKQSGVTTLVINNDELSGSGRSPLNAIDLWSKDFPIAGHQHAFGVDFASRKQAQEMYQAIKEATASTPVSIRASQVDVHAESNTPLTEIEDFLDRIQKFAPFGPGFPLPRVSITFDPSDANFKLLSAGKHLKATLPNGVDVLLWNLGGKLTDFIQAEHVNLIGTFGYNYFKDKKTVQFNVDKIFFE